MATIGKTAFADHKNRGSQDLNKQSPLNKIEKGSSETKDKTPPPSPKKNQIYLKILEHLT